MKRKHLFVILAIGMTAFIFWNSAQPAIESAQSSGRIVTIVANLLSKFGIDTDFAIMDRIVRKLAHISEFGVQAILIAASFSGRYKKRVIYVLFFGLLTACTDEYIQLFSGGRAGLIGDVFIDFCGTAAGTLLCGIFRKKRA